MAITCSATLIWFGNGLNPVWLLMWFAVLPVLWFALRSSWWSAALVAAASMMLGGVNMLHYFHSVIRIPVSAWVVVYGIVSITFAVGVLLFRALVRRGAVWSALAALPAA
ncbi:MAG TPA: hypothetical protein VGG95_01975, partial [Edaphobacter sp.]